MPSDLKKDNRSAVMQAFGNGETMTVNEVSAIIGISRQTVKKHIEYFVNKNLFSSCGKGNSSQIGGKRPELFSLNREVRLMCIALHHHAISMTLTNLYHEQISVWDSRIIRLNNMDEMWEQIRIGRDILLTENTLDSVMGVGFAAPFASDEEYRLTVATPFPHWPQTDFGRSLVQPLVDLFPNARKVLVVSDGRAAGRGVLNSYPDYLTRGTLVTLYTSYGIGGSVIRNGVLDAGGYGLIGAFGHIIVDVGEKELCACGGRGCLEQAVNRDRLRSRLREKQESCKKSCLADIPPDKVTFKQLFSGSAEGDSLCREESCHYANVFSIALRDIYLCTGPDMIVFQGDFGLADDVFKNELIKNLRSFKYMEKWKDIHIEYDQKELSEQECFGLSHLLAKDYLDNPMAYTSNKQKTVTAGE